MVVAAIVERGREAVRQVADAGGVKEVLHALENIAGLQKKAPHDELIESAIWRLILFQLNMVFYE